MERCYIYALQILFVATIALGSQSLNWSNKALSIARYVMYILTMHASEVMSVLIFEVLHKKRELNTKLFSKVNVNQLMMYGASIAVLLYNQQKLYAEDFPLICIAYLIVKYPVVITFGKKTVAIGVGMALSYVEGYLVYIIPPAGESMKTFEDKMRTLESMHGVLIPVKRFFIIITKSMYSPSDLQEFNDTSGREDVSRLEPCSSLEDVVKDVAGVKGRVYKSSVYTLRRGGRGRGRGVLVPAECATPLYTLYKAMQNSHLYEELIDVNVEDVVSDFISTMRMILDKNPQLKNTCELVYFDDTDKSLNLADVLLDRIRELEPNFEELINSNE